MVGKRPILIDSCIINYLLSNETGLAAKTLSLLEDLLKNENELYVSEFTHHEVLRGASEEKTKKAQELLKNFVTVPPSPQRLERATQLYTAYNGNEKVRNSLQSISDIDVFIGSLIFTSNKALLLTADYFDFPRPFFKEAGITQINYVKNRGNKTSIYYYLLEGNLDAI